MWCIFWIFSLSNEEILEMKDIIRKEKEWIQVVKYQNIWLNEDISGGSVKQIGSG